ncbi:hypothetical protein [Actinophytocola sp.]|uniref:hypothetical protein n=1 Tax=Actinophytocola sp. TaxID=1872138 RepID=UPI002ED15D0C
MGVLNAITRTIAWCVIFFFAIAQCFRRAGAGYLRFAHRRPRARGPRLPARRGGDDRRGLVARFLAVDAEGKSLKDTQPLTGITALAAGSQFTLSRTAAGTMFAWGANFDGMLGDHTATERQSPAQVVSPDGSRPLTGVTAIGAGYWHSLAARS